jgi:hypothetical protein
MKFTRNGSVQLMAGMIVGVGAIVVACGGDDSTGTTSSTSSSGGSSGATSSSGGSSGGSSGTASSSGSTTDGGGTDGGGEGGAKKANGVGPCTAGTECVSGECFVAKKNNDSYCTIKCTMTGQVDPACMALGATFSGKCNGDGYCQKVQ